MQEMNGIPTFESMKSATAATATEAPAPVAAPAPEAAPVAPVAAETVADAGETKFATVADGKNVMLPQHAFTKLKEEQRQRGKREAVNELEAKFKAAGFSSLDDAIAAMAAVRNNTKVETKVEAKPEPKAAPAPKQAPKAVEVEATADEEAQETVQPQANTTADKQMQRLMREREKLAKQFAAEQAQRRKLQRQLEAKEAEFALRETAVGKGVKDVDYAVRLVTRELTGKTEQQLASFDEGKFFDNLRKTHPYLFGEMVVPATTGTGVGAAPAAPTAGNVQVAQGAASKFDARDPKLTTADFHRALRARGFSPPV